MEALEVCSWYFQFHVGDDNLAKFSSRAKKKQKRENRKIKFHYSKLPCKSSQQSAQIPTRKFHNNLVCTEKSNYRFTTLHLKSQNFFNPFIYFFSLLQIKFLWDSRNFMRDCDSLLIFMIFLNHLRSFAHFILVSSDFWLFCVFSNRLLMLMWSSTSGEGW